MSESQDLLVSGLLPTGQEPNVSAPVGGMPILPSTSRALTCPDPQAHLCQRPGDEWWVLQPVSVMAHDLGLLVFTPLCGLLLCQIIGVRRV